MRKEGKEIAMTLSVHQTEQGTWTFGIQQEAIGESGAAEGSFTSKPAYRTREDAEKAGLAMVDRLVY